MVLVTIIEHVERTHNIVHLCMLCFLFQKLKRLVDAGMYERASDHGCSRAAKFPKIAFFLYHLKPVDVDN